jgi:hypothetical protein
VHVVFDTDGYGDGGMVLNIPHGLVGPAPLMLAGPLRPGMGLSNPATFTTPLPEGVQVEAPLLVESCRPGAA